MQPAHAVALYDASHFSVRFPSAGGDAVWPSGAVSVRSWCADAGYALRHRELTQVAKDIAAETGLEHCPVVDGQRVVGIF